MDANVLTGPTPAAGPVVTEPGIYQLTSEQYHADPVPAGSLSSTGARRLLAACPAKFEYERRHPQQPTRALDLGTAAHRLVLGDGPDLVAIDADDWRTRAAREERDDVRAEGGLPLLVADYDRVQNMAAALRQHPIAAALLAPGSGLPEQSLFWVDEPTGVWCRARPDWLPHRGPGRMLVADFKTTRDGSPAGLARAMETYGYHQQAAWYLDGIRTLGLADNPVFLLVFQESDPPHVVTVAELTAPTLRIAAAKNRRALQEYAKCAASGVWPGYVPDTAPYYLSLPPWAEIRDTEEYL